MGVAVVMRDWDDVIAAITRVVSDSLHKYSDQTLSNALVFCEMARERYKLPADVNAGYWPTIQLHWSATQPVPIELEIHKASFELYEFSGKLFKVSEFDPGPSGAIPEALVQRLDEFISR
jgi:hypothetical protein